MKGRYKIKGRLIKGICLTPLPSSVKELESYSDNFNKLPSLLYGVRGACHSATPALPLFFKILHSYPPEAILAVLCRGCLTLSYTVVYRWLVEINTLALLWEIGYKASSEYT